jgi:glycoprotein endo-alpha-1,2-mannosidase
LKNKNQGLGFILFVLAFSAFNPVRGAELEPLVLAFYYPWYHTLEFSGAWDHWNGEGHDPEVIDSQGRRDIMSAHYPAGDAYDSLDPEVIRRHLAESDMAGIDAWIVSWWGQGYHPDPVKTILDTISQTGSRLKITLYYEVVPECLGYACDNLKPEERIQGVISDLDFIWEHYSSHPAFLRLDDRPVMFIYTRTMLQAYWQWPQIIEKAQEQQNWFFSGDCITTLMPFFAGKAFDQVHFYNPVVEADIFTARFLRYASFVRFAHALDKTAALTVIPGYDERRIPSRPLQMYMDRRSGSLYKILWSKTIKARPDWVLITTFNEWHEGTEIEPSIEYGEEYLCLTKQFSEKFKKQR